MAMALMGVGALFWVGAAVLWGTGTSVIRLAVWLAAFLVLTIVGERLELSRLRVPSKASERRMVAAAAGFALGAAPTVPVRDLGLVVAGVVAAGSVRIARRSPT